MSRSTPEGHETANDRFKRGFANWFWGGLVLATLLHAALFLTAPTFATQDFSFTTGELSVTELPEDIRIPPAPDAIPRPAAPVIVDDAPVVDDDLTIPPTTLAANPVERLPPPPSRSRRGEESLEDAPVFTPMTVEPRLENSREISRALERHYPPLFRDAGIGGTVTVWFFIDQNGRVAKTQIHTSSGYDAFDDAALLVADMMRFTPAYNRDERVPVWVSLPIVFEVQR